MKLSAEFWLLIYENTEDRLPPLESATSRAMIDTPFYLLDACRYSAGSRCRDLGDLFRDRMVLKLHFSTLYLLDRLSTISQWGWGSFKHKPCSSSGEPGVNWKEMSTRHAPSRIKGPLDNCTHRCSSEVRGPDHEGAMWGLPGVRSSMPC